MDLRRFRAALLVLPLSAVAAGVATEGAAYLVKDINRTPDVSSNPSGFTVAGSRIFFAADDGESGSELWAMPLSVLRQARTPRPVSFRP